MGEYNAIFCKAERKIVAHVQCQISQSAAFAGFPGFEHVPESSDGEDDGEKRETHKDSGLAATWVLSRSRMQLRLDDPTSRSALMLQTWNLCSDLQVLFNLGTSSDFGLTVENVSAYKHDEVLEFLKKLSLSLVL